MRRLIGCIALLLALLPLASAEEMPVLTAEFAVTLPEDAVSVGMNVYPLSDGTFLIAYHCVGSDRLWMRVISETGEKLFAKSVPEMNLAQITLTGEGFLCETFEDSEICSGKRYTYTCKGRKWQTETLRYVDDSERYDSTNTAHFTVRRYPFGEGCVIPMEIEHRPSGAVTRRLTFYGGSWLLSEYRDCSGQDNLLVYGQDEQGVLCVRRYDASGELTGMVPTPFEGQAASAYGCGDAVYFYVGSDMDWQRWRLDCDAFAFDEAPEPIAVPISCELSVITGGKAGDHLLVVDNDFSSCIGTFSLSESLQLRQAFPGDAVWVYETEDGFLMLLHLPNGEFKLRRYRVAY